MQIDEQTFKKMPPHLQAMFVQDANPARDEVVGAFPTQNSGKVNPNLKRHAGGGVIYGKCDGGQPKVSHGGSGSAARFFYSAKASKADRNGSKHPTVKPIALMEWLATLITPPGGTILDPFAGSGTTGAAAVRNGFRCILCEREDEYIEDIKRRLGTSDPLSTLLQWNERVRAFKAQGVAVAKGVAVAVASGVAA